MTYNNFQNNLNSGNVVLEQNKKDEIIINNGTSKEKNIQISPENKINKEIHNNIRIKFYVKNIENNISSNNKNNQLIQKKRIKPNNKGYRQDIMLKRFQSNFFKDTEEELNKRIKNSHIYNFDKNIKLNSKRKKINTIYKASEILELLEQKLKEVLSRNDKHNEEVINTIFELHESSLIDILNKSIKELMDIYVGKILLKEYSGLQKCYRNLINKLREQKNNSYIEDFEGYAKNYEKIFININNNNSKKIKK